ncbi:2885_t:CDS:2 [Acaulospora colombiana]|uniref:2885_t:CDS:1 n=1 Tax=Acaulospora colombiana TaxID=27376 RepID=A0ACA9KC86_9GLOM|nr:2885_t:CDS:2 [Acaulospora colombiana]
MIKIMKLKVTTCFMFCREPHYNLNCPDLLEEYEYEQWIVADMEGEEEIGCESHNHSHLLHKSARGGKGDVKPWNVVEFENFLKQFVKDGPPIPVINTVDQAGIPHDFQYVDYYVYGANVPRPKVYDDALIGCDCGDGVCKGFKCKCLKMYNGGRLFYKRGTGAVNLEPGLSAIFECNYMCSCNLNCSNRVTQRGRKVRLAIKRFPEKGWGVVALERIENGTFITYYYGEVITSVEAEIRGKKYDELGNTYLFDIDFFDESEETKNSDHYYTVDARRFGNLSHFFNHSCDPNLVVYPVMTNTSNLKQHHIGFFAKRSIECNEELTFDYVGSVSRDDEDKENDVSMEDCCVVPEVFKFEDLLRNRQRQQTEICRQRREEMVSARRNLEKVNCIDSEDEANYESLLSFDEMVHDILSDSIHSQSRPLAKFRKLLAAKNLSAQQVVDLGVVPRFVELLSSEHEFVQCETCRILTHILSSAERQHVQVVADAGAIPPLVALLSKNDSSTIEHAVCALVSIAGENNSFRYLVLSAGAVDSLLSIFCEMQENDSLFRTLVWALATLCSGEIVSEKDWRLIAPALPTLSSLLNSVDEIVVEQVCWTLGSLAEGGVQQIQRIIELGVCPNLVRLMGHPSREIKIAAIRCVTNMITGDDFQTQVIINCGALQALRGLLSSEKDAYIRREACLQLSNITAGTVEQVGAVFEAGIFPILINLMTIADFGTRKEACWAVSYAIIQGCGRSELIPKMVRLGCVEPMVEMLGFKDNDLIHLVLSAIKIILHLNVNHARGNKVALHIEEIGAFAKIYNLQFHDNNEIREIATHIVERYFESDDEDGLDLSMTDSF